jgi:hypothetical protein
MCVQYEYMKQKFRKCVVNNILVQMRVSDRWLNFTSLAKAGGKSAAWKNKILAKVESPFKERCYDSNNRGMLVAFHLTLPYIAQLGLQCNKELRRLLQDDRSLDNLQVCASFPSFRHYSLQDGSLRSLRSLLVIRTSLLETSKSTMTHCEDSSALAAL